MAGLGGDQAAKIHQRLYFNAFAIAPLEELAKQPFFEEFALMSLEMCI